MPSNTSRFRKKPVQIRRPAIARRVTRLLSVTVGAVLIAVLTPVTAHAASASISIIRVDGKLAVEGRYFPAYASGIVKAGKGTSGSYIQQNVKANSSGYFRSVFSSLDISGGGYTWSRAWLNNSIHATTSRTFTASSSTGSSTDSSTDSGGTSGSIVFQEDFNGTSLDTSRYGLYSGNGNEGVGSRSPSAVSIGNGAIKITGRGDVGGGFAIKHYRTYGKYEIRAKLTTSVGTSSHAGYNTAMLLWPTSERWPVDGEVDISEIFSGNYDQSCSFAHWGTNNSQTGRCKTIDTSAWHTYAVEWRADKLVYSIDGVAFFTVTNTAAIPDNPHFLGVQLDVARTSTHVSGTALSVDWIKIYK